MLYIKITFICNFFFLFNVITFWICTAKTYETLKEYCKLRNYHISKLDEIVEGFEKNDFYDKIHPGINGSQKISKILYPYLKEILIKY